MKRQVKLIPCPVCGEKLTEFPLSKDDPFVWCQNIRCRIYDMEVNFKIWNKGGDAIFNDLSDLLERVS